MYFFWRVLIEGFLWGALLEITFVEPFFSANPIILICTANSVCLNFLQVLKNSTYFFWRALTEGFFWRALLKITFVEPFLVVGFMRSSFLPKYQPKMLKISAL